VPSVTTDIALLLVISEREFTLGSL
jgi:hypothetical protein